MSKETNRHRGDSREDLLRELEEFEREREQLKDVLGRIGGRNFSKRDTWVNIAFLIIILTLFVLELTTHFMPVRISLELGILLVSVKIVFMIHTQQKVNHFQFWILNSIEYRINQMAKKITSVEHHLKNGGEKS